MARISVTTAPHDLQPLTFSIEAISTQVQPSWIREALEKTGKDSKRLRKLPAEVVIQLLVALGLHPNFSIQNVLKKLSLGFQGKLQKAKGALPTSSAVTQARDRLGVEPVRRLFERQSDALRERHAAPQQYHGMPLVGVDGSTLKVPDSDENRIEFGAPKSGRGRSGFPMLRIVALLAVATHAVFAVAVGSYATGEMTLVLTLLSGISPGSMVLMDRGFVSYRLWWDLLQKQCHFATRAKRKLRFRRTRKLGEGDWIVNFTLPRALRRKHPELPETLTLRLIRYQVPGFKASWLITSLLDPIRYPAAELVLLYHARWEVEIAYAEIKTRLRPSGRPLRSETPNRVRQELYGLLIAYNAVRGLMADAAGQEKVEALRLSFTDSLERIRTAMIRMAEAGDVLQLMQLYEELLREIGACRLPPRRLRHNPRVVKVKMSGYALKRVRKVA